MAGHSASLVSHALGVSTTTHAHFYSPYLEAPLHRLCSPMVFCPCTPCALPASLPAGTPSHRVMVSSLRPSPPHTLCIFRYLLLSGTVPFGFDAEDEAGVYRSIQRDPLRLDSPVRGS
jgi:hypothetical protein